jgi:formylglycine-generating enzyme required for sulfatase activity
MLGNKMRIQRIGKIKKSIASILLVAFALNLAQGQVILVRSKLNSSKSSGKTKSKSKSRGNASSTTAASPAQSPDLAASLDATAPLRSFVVKPPDLVPVSTPDLEFSKNPALPFVKLLSYDFNVISSDNRGRVVDKRIETARYFNEELAMGMQLEMVEIPGGAFMMGSIGTEITDFKNAYVHGMEKEIKAALTRRLDWESPQHLVKIPAFYMSKFEITQAQWRAAANLPKVNRELMSDPSHFKGGNRPVDRVSWEEAVEFCERLSRATGRKYRLPTEAEWEYACRAGTNTQFSFGESIKTEWANYHGKYTFAASPKGIFRGQTAPVGSLGIPNAFGLFDMHGNVWEWCADSWHDDYTSAPEDGKSWENGGIAYLKVLRGGAWDSSASECRTNSRNRMTATIHLNNVGFRVVLEATGQQPANETRITLR